VPDRSAESLCSFVECAVVPGTSLVTDDWSGYASHAKRGYKHVAIAERGDPQVAEQYLPIIHLVFANLKTWLIGTHHGVSHQGTSNNDDFVVGSTAVAARRSFSLLI
jgi:hypothetical protein